MARNAETMREKEMRCESGIEIGQVNMCMCENEDDDVAAATAIQNTQHTMAKMIHTSSHHQTTNQRCVGILHENCNIEIAESSYNVNQAI